MGEAARKKKLAQDAGIALAQIDRACAARAVRMVVEAVSPGRGADCLFYAQVGAALLRCLGVQAQPVAGSVVWRVGPGDSDLIAHAYEVTSPGNMFAPEAGPAAPFHAWIEAGDWLIDFSTWALGDKAASLDQADGGRTDVQWCPGYVWAQRKTSMPLKQVLASFDVGVYGYVRHPEIESRVLIGEGEVSLGQACESAVLVYRKLLAGQEIRVMGVGEGEMQDSSELPKLRRFVP